MGAEQVDALDLLQHGPVVGVALLAQQPVAEGDVMGGDRPAIVEARLGPQVEYHPAAVVGKLQGFGDQPVGGIGLVARRIVDAVADHQRLVQLADAVLVEVAGTDRAGALERIGIEGVERTAAHHPQSATLGRVRVDVVEVGEVPGVLRLAKDRITVLFIDGRACRRAEQGGQ